MKRKVRYRAQNGMQEKEIVYIPVRYTVAMVLTVLELAVILASAIALCFVLPYFYIVAILIHLGCVIKIAASDDNPDYKIPWLLVILFLPVIGFMLYFLFYSRKLKRKYRKRLSYLADHSYEKPDDGALLAALGAEDRLVASHAAMLCDIADTHIFAGTEVRYFPLGERAHRAMLEDLCRARRFIFLEYFIIEEGKCWSPILAILREKAAAGVDVRVVYDDVGCMKTLPGNYDRILRGFGISAVSFARLRGQADGEINNRSHRKIMVIDGEVGYTGGMNLADEYINETVRFGHWKDVAIRLEGAAVSELTHLFLIDYGISVKRMPEITTELFPVACGEEAMPAALPSAEKGYVIPFGDGPRPIYRNQVGKLVIQNLLAGATRYVYMMTPYLIIDNDLCQSMENAALRGVDVRILLPHIPDKRIIFNISRTFYKRLVDVGVRIYEYTPGFLHAKVYLADDACAMVGTVNLDYRSLVHHFENGVWLYRTPCLADIRRDIEGTLALCEEVDPASIKATPLARFFRSIVRILSPLL